MSFERFNQHRHNVGSNSVCFSYDRFNTKFEVKVGDTIAYSKYLLFWPKHKATVQIGSSSYTLSIYWFLIWGASLKKDNSVVVKELLPKRRRRSITLLCYGVFIVLLRAAFVVFEPQHLTKNCSRSLALTARYVIRKVYEIYSHIGAILIYCQRQCK